MKNIFTVLALTGCLQAGAQLQEGKKNIDKLCGCYEVSFKYAETFSADTAYKFHKPEESGAIELVLPIERSDRKIVLQHLLVIEDTLVIKHWREDWVYEAPEQLVFEGDRKWVKKKIPAADTRGSWTQTVWEVDDAPRYQGTGNWVTTNHKTFWENTTDAPLPRREYTMRNDYNILERTNRILVTDSAWTHEQDNSKVLARNNSRTTIAEEKGRNSYRKVADARCAKGREWWNTYGKFWTIVRNNWDQYVAEHKGVYLQPKVDNKRMDQYFSKLQEDWLAKKVTDQQVAQQVMTMLGRFSSGTGDLTTK
jgi:hypothetical protein